MATYLVGRKHLAAGEHKRYVWLCGPERRLVEELADLYRRNVEASDVARFDLPGSTDGSGVWEVMSVYPVTAEHRRLVIVRNAEHIIEWSRFLDWDFEPIKGVYTLFISNESNTDTKPEHMRTILRRGRYVRCGPFTKHEDRVETLRVHRAIEPAAADLLLRRFGGDVGAALNVLDQCSYFSPDREVPVAVVDRFVRSTPNEDFVGALVELRPDKAAEACSSISSSDYAKVVGMLDYRLDALSRIHGALRKSTDIRDLARITRLDNFIVKDLIGLARRYDRRRVQVASEVLQMVDARISEGEDELILETLVALWAA